MECNQIFPVLNSVRGLYDIVLPFTMCFSHLYYGYIKKRKAESPQLTLRNLFSAIF